MQALAAAEGHDDEAADDDGDESHWQWLSWPGPGYDDEGDGDGQEAIAPGHRNWQPWVRSSAANPKIHVMAAGLQLVDLNPRADYDWDLDYKLKRKLHYHYNVTVDQLVDARTFHYPKVEKPHIGEHYRFITDLVQHPDFEWWLRGVKWEFVNREYKSEHVIVTFCRQGIHRSVGTARVIAEVLQMQGFDVEQPYSLTPYREFGAKFCSVACTECSRFYPGKLDSFMAASQIWQSI